MQVASRASKVLRMVLVGIGEVVKISLPKCCVGMIELRLLHVFFSEIGPPSRLWGFADDYASALQLRIACLNSHAEDLDKLQLPLST